MYKKHISFQQMVNLVKYQNHTKLQLKETSLLTKKEKIIYERNVVGKRYITLNFLSYGYKSPFDDVDNSQYNRIINGGECAKSDH